MAEQSITIETPDGAMELYEATPDGDARGAIVVIQEAFGVNDHIKSVDASRGRRRLPRGGAGDVPPRRWWHRRLHRLRGGDPAVRGRQRRRHPRGRRRGDRPSAQRGLRRRPHRHRRLLLRGPGDLPRRRAPRARCVCRLLRRRHRHEGASAVRAARRRGARRCGRHGSGCSATRTRRSRSTTSRRSAPRSRTRRSTPRSCATRARSTASTATCARTTTTRTPRRTHWQRTLAWFDAHLAR